MLLFWLLYFSLIDTYNIILMLEPYSFSELLGCSATNGHYPGLSLDHTARIAKTKNPLTKYLATLLENKSGDIASKNLTTQSANDPHQTWWVGSTRLARGHLHRKSAIDGAPPQIGFPPHQILHLHHPTSQNSGLEAQIG